MSELKTRFIDDTYAEYYNTGRHDLAQIYLKSEADAVIAELKDKLRHYPRIRYTGEANMLANDVLNISAMHRDYDGWIEAELDRGLKGLIAEGKTCGRIEIREPSCLPYESKHAFHDICVDCFKRQGYIVEEDLSKDPPVFVLSWDTRKPDRAPCVKQVPPLAWWYAIGFVSVGTWELGRWLGNVLWRLWS